MFEKIEKLLELRKRSDLVEGIVPFAKELVQAYSKIVYNIKLEDEAIIFSFSQLESYVDSDGMKQDIYQAFVQYYEKDILVKSLPDESIVGEGATYAKALESLVFDLQVKLRKHVSEMLSF